MVGSGFCIDTAPKDRLLAPSVVLCNDEAATMTINPREYDPEELRSASASDVDTPDVGQLREQLSKASTESDGRVPTDRLKELILIESGTDPTDLQRPYLQSIPEQYAARLMVFEWLEFALGRAGVRRSLEAFDYYVDIGWVDETVAEGLRDHVRAFQDAVQQGSGRPFEAADHLVSLVYIARLASMT
ncbi:MAG: FlaD/FlaE family flagellar protein [Haloferacaceae archaeon]